MGCKEVSYTFLVHTYLILPSMHGVQGSFLHFSSSHIPDIAKHAWGAGKFPTLFQLTHNLILPSMHGVQESFLHFSSACSTLPCMLCIGTFPTHLNCILRTKWPSFYIVTCSKCTYRATHGVQECFLHCYHSIFYPLCYFSSQVTLISNKMTPILSKMTLTLSTL